ncbi:MAG: TetR/AcrR family transcriptional regulator [Petrimonas sp.]|jgi:AcrR family transcriptional regulator|uniref:Nucleoid occlusion factor SlmA n=1 Tax=bioreactor metagenome TaxID=1076179 RepID=A0A644YFH9_9ZZZZ|nr:MULTISPECIES: TetR/AcrR family transcriptional regulator [unclassified Proteiniphilum]MDD2312013.1 TetR/AcrR family transcriptional regulator [Petrimonas sp.]NLU29029.1 TetR/AcrR family transcriptional regulator [Bacteroidales bacterium]BBD44827.1 Transcriptional regulator, TetR family (Precursor) [Petrimonas sp. IBARAKI]HAC72055.1 TetR/AcrR family transcriptional regulator [Porphyromonadaceae bacterium]MDD3541975.1 TetR/AcrR family transcriptional regulator [Petrimonas sp.]
MEITPRQLEIIEATGKILTASGANGLTIKNLAKEMQFSEGAIYRHFSSKEEIIIMMLKYLKTNISKILSNLTKTGDVEKDFVIFFTRLSLYFKENPYFVVTVFSEGLMDESDKINNEISGLMTLTSSHLEQILQEGQKQGTFIQSVASSDLTMISLATFKLHMFNWKFNKFKFNLTENIGKMSASLLALLRRNPD